MAGQEQKGKSSTETTDTSKPKEAKDVKNPELDKSTDELMDAIDEVLEENAQEFVKNYIQRGGQ